MILLFSGTGNSLHVANEISRRLGDEIVRLPVRGNRIKITDERVIWIFPVYSWGVPPVVVRWIKSIDAEGADTCVHHAVMTCGDDIGLADKMWKSLISSRGWRVGDAFSVQMPNTYVLMKGFDVDSEKLASAKIEKSVDTCVRISEKISNGQPAGKSDVVRGGFAWIKTKLIYPYFVRFEMSPKPFHSTDECTGCGSCVRICPLQNILLKSKRPVWGTDCALCLGCYHVCPHHAVAYGRITDKKGQKEILKS